MCYRTRYVSRPYPQNTKDCDFAPHSGHKSCTHQPSVRFTLDRRGHHET